MTRLAVLNEWGAPEIAQALADVREQNQETRLKYCPTHRTIVPAFKDHRLSCCVLADEREAAYRGIYDDFAKLSSMVQALKVTDILRMIEARRAHGPVLSVSERKGPPERHPDEPHPSEGKV